MIEGRGRTERLLYYILVSGRGGLRRVKGHKLHDYGLSARYLFLRTYRSHHAS